MFFNFRPFSYGSCPQQRQRLRDNQSGFGDFVRNYFMSPSVSVQQEALNRHSQDQNQLLQSKSKNKKHLNPQQVKKQKSISSENTGVYWKQKGNQEFKNGNLQKALQNYTKAIELNQTESVFFSNRSRVLKSMGKLQQALKDAQEAIEIDVDNIKGHLLSGQILAQIGKQTQNRQKVCSAIVRLTKALTLCSGQKKNQYQKQLTIYIYRAKKLLWYLDFQNLRNLRISAIHQYKSYLDKDQSLTKEQYDQKIDAFFAATDQRISFQIPDYLCCRITLDLMQDPVTTDSGHTYQKSAIEEHITKNGKFDPFTRKPIVGNLHPSIGLKKAISDFLDKNPWAYQYTQGQNYKSIQF